MEDQRVVGLSGGVDSACCALILSRQKRLAGGIYLDFNQERMGPLGGQGCKIGASLGQKDNEGRKNCASLGQKDSEGRKNCASLGQKDSEGRKNCAKGGDFSNSELEGARSLAKSLNCDFKVIDGREMFRELVIRPFVDAIIKGKTPNPCIMCNNRLKFPLLFEKARAMGIGGIATGHYAGYKDRYVFMGADRRKDQSYMLYGLTGKYPRKNDREVLEFPLQKLKKEEIRSMVQDSGLDIWSKKDSQDLCFIGKDGIAGFFARNKIEVPQLRLFDTGGRDLKERRPIYALTPGQRRGLGISNEHRLYVLALCPKGEMAIVGPKEEGFCLELTLEDFIGLYPEKFARGHFYGDLGPFRVRLRYRGQPLTGYLRYKESELPKIIFAHPVFVPAPGQYGVLYRGARVYGGGIIKNNSLF